MKNLLEKKTAQTDEEAPSTLVGVNAWEPVVEQREEIVDTSAEKLQVGTSESTSSPAQTRSPVEEPENRQPTRSADTNPAASPQVIEERHEKPSKGRLFLRIWQLLAAVGLFGFQYGATPYSRHQFPFNTSAGLVYYMYAISWLSFIWSLFMIYVYMTRRFGRGNKIMRPVAFFVDIILAAAFGVGVIYEIIKYQCKPGYFDGWCNFFNTGIFFAMTLFVSYVVQGLWDLFGGLSCLRRR